MRNESDDETSTASDEDIFSSSGEEDAESSEEMNDSDESKKEDPWRVLIHYSIITNLKLPSAMRNSELVLGINESSCLLHMYLLLYLECISYMDVFGRQQFFYTR